MKTSEIGRGTAIVTPRSCAASHHRAENRGSSRCPFAFFGGVPQSILYDNTKLAAARICGDGTRERIRAFAGLISHYLFFDRFGRLGKGNDRGKVEVLLLPKIREAYRAEEIDPQTIRHLTLASPDQQAEWFRLFGDPGERAPRGRQLKQWLFGAEISADAALFPLEQYTGGIVSDLFGENRYFDDAGQFWNLQNAAIAAKREALLAEGWAAVTILEIGERFWSWEHVPPPKEDGGHVFIEVFESGEVKIHEGYLSEKAYRQRQRQTEGGDEAENTAAADRPEPTKAAQNYLHLHRHAAVRHALLSHPGAALRLMAAHVIVGSSLWRVEPEPQKAGKTDTVASLQASKAEGAFAEERKEVLGLLGLPEDNASVVRNNTDDYRLVRLFAVLLKRSDKQVMRVLAFVMAETLEAGSGTVEALGAHLNVNMWDYWQPDEAFFTLLRDKAAINAMLADIAGASIAKANVATTAKVQKKDHRGFWHRRGPPQSRRLAAGLYGIPVPRLYRSRRRDAQRRYRADRGAD